MKKFNNRPNKCYQVDGKEVWESRSVAVVGVIIAEFDEEQYVLIGKRGTGLPDYVGYWNVPCGYMDWDEDGTDALYREIFEETGFDLQSAVADDIPNNEILPLSTRYIIQPFYVNTNVDEPRQNVSLSYGAVFRCLNLPDLTTENSEPNEVEEVRWININNIDNYKFAFNHDKRIRMFLEKLTNVYIEG